MVITLINKCILEFSYTDKFTIQSCSLVLHQLSANIPRRYVAYSLSDLNRESCPEKKGSEITHVHSFDSENARKIHSCIGMVSFGLFTGSNTCSAF